MPEWIGDVTDAGAFVLMIVALIWYVRSGGNSKT